MIQYEQSYVTELQEVLNPLIKHADINVEISLSAKISTWAKNKEAIYNMMGGVIRVEKKVAASFSAKEIQEMIYSLTKRFYRRKEFTLACWFLNSIKEDEIMNNALATERVILGKKFNSGMKVSRVLLQLIPEANGARNEFQIEYSKILESFGKDRTLVLSIDPLDYFMMSENTTGWRSCQSLDGQYKTATLAYLLDSVTMVAYVITESGRKCWRQLIYVSPASQYAIQSRQYPATNTAYSKATNSLLKEMFNWPEAKRERVDVNYILSKDLIRDKDACEFWYNDITRESVDTVSVLYNSAEESFSDFVEFTEHEFLVIKVGVNSMRCICGCGEWINSAECLFSEVHFEYRESEEWEEEQDDN